MSRRCIRCPSEVVEGLRYCQPCSEAIAEKEEARLIAQDSIDYEAEFLTLSAKYNELSDKYSALLESTISGE